MLQHAIFKLFEKKTKFDNKFCIFFSSKFDNKHNKKFKIYSPSQVEKFFLKAQFKICPSTKKKT